MKVERLDQWDMGAGVCGEIGLAPYLDRLAVPTDQQVSIGMATMATMAMIRNGLGLSYRRLYLLSQFIAAKQVEHLLDRALLPICSTATAWDKSPTSCMLIIRRHCLLGSRTRRGCSMACGPGRCISTRPRLRSSAGSTSRMPRRLQSRMGIRVTTGRT